MHKNILKLFDLTRSLLHFIKIVFVFLIMMLAFYWVQNILGAQWNWLNFLKPFFDFTLSIAGAICSWEFSIFGANIELKYVAAMIIYVILMFVCNLLNDLSYFIEDIYKDANTAVKKTQENILNRSLEKSITKEQKKLNKYTIVISTRPKQKYVHMEQVVDMEEQNRIMNKYMIEQTWVQPTIFEGGYLYTIEDFERIDYAIDILYKVLESKAPIEYAICVQAGDNLEQLKKLVELKLFGKIAIASDTSYRYSFNKEQRYNTTMVGLFQDGANTLEVHEFIQKANVQ